jgi:hypothetical protein
MIEMTAPVNRRRTANSETRLNNVMFTYHGTWSNKGYHRRKLIRTESFRRNHMHPLINDARPPKINPQRHLGVHVNNKKHV